MMDLNEKIKNRETELQRAYDSYLLDREKCINSIKALKRAIESEELKLKQIIFKIDLCRDRAIEQDSLNAP